MEKELSNNINWREKIIFQISYLGNNWGDWLSNVNSLLSLASVIVIVACVAVQCKSGAENWHFDPMKFPPKIKT